MTNQIDPGSHVPHPSCPFAEYSHESPAVNPDIYTEILKAHVASRHGLLTIHFLIVSQFPFLSYRIKLLVEKSILFCCKPFP